MQLIKTVKSLAGVKLVRRKTAPTRESAKLAYLRPEMQDGITSSQRFVLIGASTGGPQTIRQIVEDLPSDYPLPIICAQHMAQGFMPGFVTWLNEAKTLKAKIAEDGEHLLPGHFYLAPDDFHTGLNANGQVFLASAPKEFGMRPSVAFLFRSAIPFAERIIAVLLTGMGRDGADDMGRLLKGGARTIAQNKASSIVFGMPAEAIALGHAQEVLGTNEIARKLIALENQGLHFSKTAQTIDKR
jgi:two-component system chemotaxis response regulator CheB